MMVYNVYNNDSSTPRNGTVSVHIFFFPGGSLSREPVFVGALARGHRFGEVCIKGGADFFEPNLVCLHFLLWTDRESLHALQNTNQPVHILVPQIDFSVQVDFQLSRFLSPTLRRNSDHVAHRERQVRT
jgi:hypothetical protein